MGSTTHGITYPDPSGVPARNAQQVLATSVDSAVWGGQLLQSGQTSCTFSAAASSTPVTITFAVPFKAVPRVVACTQNYDLIAAVSGITAAGFTLTLGRPAGAITYTAIGVQWIAVGATT